MILNIPSINEVIEKCDHIQSKSHNNNDYYPISYWMKQHKLNICNNIKFVDEKNDMEILRILIADYLMRAMKGERGDDLLNKLKQILKDKSDLTDKNYRLVVKNANYRWGEEIGSKVIADVVEHFKKSWDFAGYFNEAKQKSENNFCDDKILKIKNISYKVRDLALSNFDENYVAFDLHLARVPTRIGLLNHGFDLPQFVNSNKKIEMGNNPAINENYLFLHRIFRKFSIESGYSMVELDRFFWHFGRTVCNANPNCKECPINNICLTGIHRKNE